jgi:hypothetical protein
MGIRVFAGDRLDVYIPDVPTHQGQHGEPDFPGHLYRAGTFGNLFTLSADQDYRLEGVTRGQSRPDWEYLSERFIVFSLKDDNLPFTPKGVHARISLPWPESINGVRQLVEYMSPKPLFTKGPKKDPRLLRYIYVITYNLAENDRPVLYQGATPFWHSEALEQHNRLHVFADPPQALLHPKDYEKHTKHAYVELSRQLFGSPSVVEANTASPLRNSFLEPVTTEEIPAWEQVDLVHARMHIKVVGCTGNCLAVMIKD